MTAALVAGLLAGYGIAMPVGAVATYLVGLTARTGVVVGGAAALGIASADGLYALVAVVGGATLTGLISAVADPLRWVSAAVLTVLAVRIAWTAVREHRSGTSAIGAGAITAPGRAYLSLFGITLLNPMTVLYFGALVAGGQANGTDGSQWCVAAVFVIAAFAASASWQFLLVAGGVALGRTMTGQTGRLVTGLASGAVIAVFAVAVLARS